MATAAKFVQPIPIFFTHLVPLDVDVTGNITAKICEVWSKFNIFSWLPWQWSPFSIFFNPPKAAFLQSFMKFDERNPIFFLNPPFFCFHGNCGKPLMYI